MSRHWIKDRLPLVLPPLWTLHERRLDGAHYLMGVTFMSVIFSGEEHDGKRWLHLSVALPSRCPTWAELVDVKEFLIGKEEYAAQIIPPRSKHVNVHPYCLHLFSPVDGWPLPDFTQGSGLI